MGHYIAEAVLLAGLGVRAQGTARWPAAT